MVYIFSVLAKLSKELKEIHIGKYFMMREGFKKIFGRKGSLGSVGNYYLGKPSPKRTIFLMKKFHEGGEGDLPIVCQNFIGLF